MRYLALVTDYDGVIARNGRASESAVRAIERLQKSGRRVVLVTGRTLKDLARVFPKYTMFDSIVAENGGVVFNPRTRRESLLGKAPSEEFVQRLRDMQVEPLEVGQVIVSTWLPHHLSVLKAIQEMGLELHIIFNRAAVMVLPPGVNKAAGMVYALRQLGLSPHEVVGVGDSENDHSFLALSECPATVANAVPSIQKLAALTTQAENGAGLAELIDRLISTDLVELQGSLDKNVVAIGKHQDGTPVTIAPYGSNILIAGPSGSGKSTVTAGLVERLFQQKYQLCIVDPEGDYGALPDIITLGNQKHAVTVSEVLAILEDPTRSLNVNLLGIPLSDRPEFFGQLFPSLQSMRTRTGRPHWIVLDEAHHMLPAEWSHVGQAMPQKLGETVLVTVHPGHLPPAVLSHVNLVVAVGPSPRTTIQSFADVTGRGFVWPEGLAEQRGNAVVWFPNKSDTPFPIQIIPGVAERIRHHRKYAEGNMYYHSFFFRGPGNRHNLKAQNLAFFSQIADGIDEETWMFHLRRGDYSRWFRTAVKDRYMAEQAEQIEQRQDLRPDETRHLIRGLIESRYTLSE